MDTFSLEDFRGLTGRGGQVNHGAPGSLGALQRERGVEGASSFNRYDFNNRLAVRSTPDMRDVGLALHAVIAEELVDPEHREAKAWARSLLEAYGVQDYL